MSPTGSRRFSAPAVNLRYTLGLMTNGGMDPRRAVRDDGFWLASLTPQGPCTWRIFRDDAALMMEAWGPGTDWALERGPDFVGTHDPLEQFEPDHPIIRRAMHSRPGLRLPRAHRVVDALIPVIAGQLVTTLEAKRSYRNLVMAHGEEAPGPVPLRLPPSPGVVAKLPDHAFIRLGFLPKLGRTIRGVCGRAHRMEEAMDMNHEDANRRLRAMPGIGPWTAQFVLATAFGYADAVPIGDLHLPEIVTHALTGGQEQGDDARMLDLLEPFQPHRFRVIQLAKIAGLGPAKRAPRAPVRPIPRG